MSQPKEHDRKSIPGEAVTFVLNTHNVLGATTTYRTPERMVDGTCTQVWAWMTNKCRRRMYREKGYITSEISQKERRLLGGRAPGKRGELGIHILGRGVLSPWDVGLFDSVFLSSYLIIAHSQTSCRPIRAQLLDPLSTNSL